MALAKPNTTLAKPETTLAKPETTLAKPKTNLAKPDKIAEILAGPKALLLWFLQFVTIYELSR